MIFVPKIISFFCNWSLPTGLEVSGPSTLFGHQKTSIVRVKCVGRMDAAILLETFVRGADGVLLVGCNPGDCHFIEGNLQTEQRINMLKKLISKTGLEAERLRLEWAYASEAERFKNIIDDFRNKVKALGPSPLAGDKPDTKILMNVKAAKAATEDFRVRVLVERKKQVTEKENMYGDRTPEEEITRVLDLALEEEYLRNRIYLLVKNRQFSVKELSELLGVDAREVLYHISAMRQAGLIMVNEIKGTTPLYIALEGR